MVANSRRWIDGRGLVSQAACAPGNLLCGINCHGAAAGGMQLQFDHAHNHRYPGGHLYRDRERGIGDSYENNHGTVHGAIGNIR
jgi:hypothetical protein